MGQIDLFENYSYLIPALSAEDVEYAHCIPAEQ